MRTSSNELRRTGGYTLIELLTVLVLIFILVGLAAPALEGYVHHLRINRAMDRVVSDLSLARMYAVRERRRVEMRFGPGATYRLDTLNAGGTPAALKTTNLKADYPGVAFVGGQGVAMIRFDSRGLVEAPTTGGYVKLVGQDARDSVLVSPAGRVYRAN